MTRPGPIKTNCPTCQKEIGVWPYQQAKQQHVYCSETCRSSGVHTGRKRPASTCAKISAALTGNSNAPTGAANSAWRGQDVGYTALHKWVYRWFGKADHCAFCGKTEGNFQWANVSHQYLRDRDDWEMLCIPCHKKYDLDYVKNIQPLWATCQ